MAGEQGDAEEEFRRRAGCPPKGHAFALAGLCHATYGGVQAGGLRGSGSGQAPVFQPQARCGAQHGLSGRIGRIDEDDA